MLKHKQILLSAALAITAAPLFAAEVTYKEAAAPWSAEQAAKLPPALTADVLKKFGTEHGLAAAAALSGKKTDVSALVKRFKTCDLTPADVRTAEKYFTREFKTEVSYFANGGCAVFKAAVAGIPAAAARSDSLSALEGVAAGGTLSTYQGSSRFFDGSSGRDAAAGPAPSAGAGSRASDPSFRPAPGSKPLAAHVPAPISTALDTFRPERPANLGKDGMANTAVDYWDALRRKNWETFKKEELSRSDRAKAFLKAAAGARFGGLLMLSNLPQVEIAAARLGWDVGQGAGGRVIAADSARLAFHSGVFLLALLPIPITKVLRAAAAGEAWAIALSGAMASGPVNRYVLHIA